MQLTLKKKKASDISQTFYVDEGSTYTENFNETLDSAVVRISHLENRLNIEPFDEVILIDEGNRFPNKYMCIDTFTETMESLDPISYSYEIHLFSETKQLENMLLPNLSITKPDGGWKSLWHYAKWYLELYGEKKRMKLRGDFNYTNTVSLGGGLNEEVTEDVRIEVQEGFKNAVLNGTYHFFDMSVVAGTVPAGSKVVINNEKIVVTSNDVYVLANVYHKRGSNVQLTVQMSMTYNYYSSEQSATVRLCPKHKFSIETFNLLKNAKCPEMQWNTPTLREVFNDLLMTQDCIPVVSNGIIGHLDLTKKKRDISRDARINYIQRSQSSSDYVSELKMNIVNGMQKDSGQDFKTTVVTTPWMTFRADDGGYCVTSSNCYLKVQYPILKVKHCYMKFTVGRKRTTFATEHEEKYFKTYTIDLCNINGVNLLFEKSEYNVLPVERWADLGESFVPTTQNKAIFFERGGMSISGFTTTTKKAFGFGSMQNTVQWIKEIYAGDQDIYNDEIQDIYLSPDDATNCYYSTFFKIEYETTADAVFKAGRDLPLSHERVIADNQTNSYVDVYNQGFMEYQKVNRLGNLQLFINARFENNIFENIIAIGDYYNDSIVYQTQYKFYTDHIDINAIATKNYVLRDYFTGVKAQIRSWKIAGGNEALTRHDLQKYYLEFSTKRKTEVGTVLRYPLPQYFLEPVNNYFSVSVASNVNYCGMYVNTETVNFPGTANQLYSPELVTRLVGNSIVFTFGADDNFEFGKRNRADITSSNITRSLQNYCPTKVKKTYTDNYGGFPLQPLRYVDNNGSFTKAIWVFANNITEPAETDGDLGSDFLLKAFEKPVVWNEIVSGTLFYDVKTIMKDNKEIFKLSVQFELCSDTRNIVFTKRFLELQKFIKSSNYPVHRYRIFVRLLRANERYDFRNTEMQSLLVEKHITQDSQIVVEQLDYLTSKITLPVSPPSHSIIYVTDENKNVLLMTYGIKEFYLNALQIRDSQVYDENGEPVGTIESN